jgi:hypothetical protein
LDLLPAPLRFDATAVENNDVVGRWKKLRCTTHSQLNPPSVGEKAHEDLLEFVTSTTVVLS